MRPNNSVPPGSTTGRRRAYYLIAGLLVIALGIISRTVDTNSILINKYLGDALYATLIYLMFRSIHPNAQIPSHMVSAIALAFAIELFQLTQIPLNLRESESLALRLISIVLGTKFQWLDVAAYAVGVVAVGAIDRAAIRSAN